MSIYGPPTAPPGRHSGRPERRLHARTDGRAGLKLALWFTGFVALIGITVAAYASFMARQEMTRELKSAEEARRDARRALEAAGLETAERLPPFERPKIDPPEPLQSAEILPRPATPPADEAPARLQTAEILR